MTHYMCWQYLNLNIASSVAFSLQTPLIMRRGPYSFFNTHRNGTKVTLADPHFSLQRLRL